MNQEVHFLSKLGRTEVRTVPPHREVVGRREEKEERAGERRENGEGYESYSCRIRAKFLGARRVIGWPDGQIEGPDEKLKKALERGQTSHCQALLGGPASGPGQWSGQTRPDHMALDGQTRPGQAR